MLENSIGGGILLKQPNNSKCIGRLNMKRYLLLLLVLLLALSGVSCGSDDNPAAPTTPTVTYNLRDTGPAGGIIFYINPNASTDGWTYLEAWTADESGNYDWKTSQSTTSGTSTAIGTGYLNTYTYMAGTAHPAAEVVRNATHGGKNDWFLPSKDELNLMYVNLKVPGVGGFTDALYWSSSENDSNFAWIQHFGNGYPGTGGKNGSLRVRAVRAF